MVAVTAIALVAGVGFAAFAVDRMHEAEVAQTAKARADADKAQARKQAADAVEKLDAMQRDLDDLQGKVAQAQHALDLARTEAERKQAQALLDAANRKAREAKDRLEQQRREREHQQRLQGFDATHCSGPLGCIDKH
jgi:peptidoglycan hydrolase CwlO-like protein